MLKESRKMFFKTYSKKSMTGIQIVLFLALQEEKKLLIDQLLKNLLQQYH